MPLFFIFFFDYVWFTIYSREVTDTTRQKFPHVHEKALSFHATQKQRQVGDEWVTYLPDESHGGRNGQTFVVGQDHGAAVVQDRVQQLHLVRVTLKHRG